MKTIILTSLSAAFIAALASCDSPELVKKRDEQALEITKLRGELQVLEERLKDLPPDRTEDLSVLEKEAKAQAEEVAKLEEEVKDLEAKKEAVQKEFEEYKRKYVLR